MLQRVYRLNQLQMKLKTDAEESVYLASFVNENDLNEYHQVLFKYGPKALNVYWKYTDPWQVAAMHLSFSTRPQIPKSTPHMERITLFSTTFATT